MNAHRATGHSFFLFFPAIFQILFILIFFTSAQGAVQGEWRFNECAWNGTPNEVRDSGANGYHGTGIGSTVSSTAKFCRSGDLTANSTGDYVILDNRAADGLTDFTVSVWIKTANNGNQAILSGANSSQDNEMLMFLTSGTSLSIYLRGNSRAFPIANVADNAWHHLVWTRSGATNCIYRDGVLQGSCQNLPAAALSIAAGGLIVGQEQDSVGGGFDINQEFEGYIDTLLIDNTALNSAAVAALYAAVPTTGCPTCVTPSAEWRFDECSWNGTAGEIKDQQGSASGIRVGEANTVANGQLCRAGSFDGSGDYADLGNTLNTVIGNTNSQFTITAWIKPTVLNPTVTNHQTANPFIAKASDGFNDNLEIGVNTNGTLHLYLDTQNRDTFANFGTAGDIVVNSWNFVAVTYNNGVVTATINNSTYSNTITWAGGGNLDSAVGSPFTIGASTHGEAGTNNDVHFTGSIDEVRVYAATLDADGITAIRNETRSSCSLCITPLADYHFDECVFTDNQAIDSTGTYPGSTSGGIATEDDPTGPIYRVANLAGGAVDLAALPVSTAAGAKTTVSFWMKWDGTNNVMPFGWNRYDLWLASDQFGFNTFSSDRFGFAGATALLANNWRHVTAVFTNGDVSQNKIYIDGVARAMSQVAGTPNNGNARVGAIARIGGDMSNTGYRFRGKLDEVMIFDGELSAAAIATIYANQAAGRNFDNTARSSALCAIPRADYRFDECAWNGTVNEVADSSPNSFHGTASNATISNTAQFCRSGDFTANSTTDFVSLDNRAADGLTDFTVSAWVKSSNNGNQAIISGANSSQNNEMLMFLVNGSSLATYLKGNSRTFPITSVADNSWHHLVWTRSGSTNCIYRDGVQQGSCQTGLPSTALSIPAGGLIIGQEQDSVGGGFDINQEFEGNIDQLRIYSSALSSSEVSALFNETQAGCPSCVPPAAEWRFDECQWNGTSNEVSDARGVTHGTRQGDATAFSGGKLCQAGTFDGAGDYVDMGDGLNTIFGSTNNVFTVTSWLKPTTLTAAKTNHQTANTFFAKASDSYNDNIEFGINPNGTVHVYIDSQGKDAYADFGTPGSVVLNSWNFVAVSYNSGIVTVNINGTSFTNTTTWSGGGNIDNAANSNLTVGASIHIDNYFTGAIDEVRVYQATMVPAVLASIMTETRPGCTFCSTPVADYHFDECAFSANVATASTGPNGTITGSVSSEDDSGVPICRVANFAGGAIDLNTLPVSTAAGARTTVSFWMKWDGTTNVMPFGWNRYDLWLASDQFGFNTFAGDRFGFAGATALLANNWRHVTAVFTNGNVSQNKIYIDGIARAVSQIAGTPNNANAVVAAIARIGGDRSNTGYRFRGKIDEVMIFNNELSAGQIATLYANQAAGKNYNGTARTCACGTVQPDHYTISHSGNGITCEAETVTITAHDAGELPVTVPSPTTITLTTSSGNGDWHLVSGGGTLNNGAINDGIATYTFPGGTNNVVLKLAHSVTATVDIDVTDGTVSAPDNGGIEDRPLVFSDSGLRFYQNGSNNTIGTQIAGRSSNLNPGPEVLTLKAVKTSTDTGACVARITGSTTVDLGYECVSPASCSAGNRVGIINGTSTLTCTAGSPGGTAIGSNPGGSSANKNPVNLTFDASGIATMTMVGCDAGKIALHAKKTLAASGTDPAVTLLGSSNSFVVKPAGICVYSDDPNAGCTVPYASCTAFKKAGETFTLKIKGVDWENAADADFCTGNTVTPNYSHNGMNISYAQSAPAAVPVPAPTLAITALDLATNPNHTVSGGIHAIADQSINEVGVFTFTVNPPAYIDPGVTIAASTSTEIGRFYPSRFTVLVSTPPVFANTCVAGAFTYMDQSFSYGTEPIFIVTAVNTAGGITRNYGGDTTGEDFWKLDVPTMAAGNYADTTGTTSTFWPSAPGTASWIDGTLVNTAADFDGTGSLSISAASFLYNRPSPPIGSFASSVDLTLTSTNLTDSDGTCYDVEPDGTCDSFTIPGITGNTLRWGRVLLGNTFGPEDAVQTMLLSIEYFDGSTFIAHPADTCTAYNGATLSCAGVTGPVVCTDVTPGGAGIQNSQSFSLSAPGTTGILQFTLPVDSWLRYDWDGDTSHDNNPAANATFGIYRGNDRIINWREILR